MERINTTTADITQENIAKLAEIFPDVVTESTNEGGVILSVDFDALQENLSVEACLSSYPKERYQFTWPGKREAKLEARRPINKTLKPCPEKSVNWDTTENLYIEGDNKDTLKIMRETYMHKVKMIYIDPPYNTGHDFVYPDNFAQSKEEYFNEDGSFDEEGNRLVENLKSDGKYHSKWCTNIYSRLLLAKDFLTEDGVIFISIDDNEQANLRKICDEVFGSCNFLAEFPRVTKKGGKSSSSIAKNHDYILAYSKNMECCSLKGISHTDEGYCNRDEFFEERGAYKLNQTLDYDSLNYNQSLDYPITIKDKTYYPGGSIDAYKDRHNGIYSRADWAWRWSKELFEFGLSNGFIEIKKGTNRDRIYTKTYEKVRIAKHDASYVIEEIERTKPVSTLYFCDNKFSNDNAKKNLIKVLESNVFDYTKPISLIKLLLEIVNDRNCIVMDFFGGSSTTAHAVMDMNLDDGGQRKFILVQYPDNCAEKSDAYNAGFKSICEIGEERIRRAGSLIMQKVDEANKAPKLGEELKKIPDVGFRVFEVAESNIKDMTLSPGEIHQMNFEELNADNLKEGATNLDLLYEVLPKFRIKYSADVETKMLCDKEVFVVNGSQLVACFDTDITNDVIQAIAEIKPLYAVFRDASFANEAARTNLEEIFKAYSPDTQLRVI